MPGLLQTADTDFEQTLADLAHAQLRDKAPALLDFLVGFQVVDRNEEGTHGVGVLGFKIGKQIMLAPVFFLNGELKMSLLFLKRQDLFLPLKDNWVTYLLNRRPAVMGVPETEGRDRLGVQYPDLTGLSNQRAGEGFSVKLSAAASRTPWMAGAERMFASLNSPDGVSSDLPAFLAKEAATRPVFLRTLRNNATLLNATLRIYDWPTLQKACSAAAPPRPAGGTTMPKSFKLPASVKRSEFLDRKRALMDASGPHRVRVLYGPDAAERAISDEDRETLLRGDILVKDAREDANVAYEVARPKAIMSPSENGIHAILTADGEFKNFFVAVGPRPFSRGFVRSALVVDPETGAFAYVWPESVWAKPNVDVASGYKSFFDGLAPVDSVEPGHEYVVVTDDLDASVVFAAEQKTTKTNGDVVVEIRQRIDNPGRRPSMDTHYSARQIASLGSGPAAHASLDRTDIEPELKEFVSTRQRNIIVTDKVKRMTPVNATMFVPRTAKVIKVQSGDSWPGLRVATPTAMAELELDLLKAGAESLSLAKTASGFYVNGKGPMRYPTALSALIQRMGLREKQSRAMLDELRDDESRRFLVKNAIGLAPDIPDPAMTQDPYTGVNMIMPQDKEIVLDALASGRRPDYAETVSPADQRGMLEAALSGQKEVFDTAAIASLVRTSDNDEMITKYLSEIIRGLDRVCRVLFLYYWFNEKFRDRYGQENMVELEDQLKNVVTSLGDLVLFLKQRRVESGPMLLDADLDLGRA